MASKQNVKPLSDIKKSLGLSREESYAVFRFSSTRRSVSVDCGLEKVGTGAKSDSNVRRRPLLPPRKPRKMSAPATGDKPVPKPRRRPPPQAPVPQGDQAQPAKVPIIPPSPRTPRSSVNKMEFAATTEEEAEVSDAAALGVIQESSNTLETIDNRPRLPTPDISTASPQKPTDCRPNSTPSPPASSLPEDDSPVIYSYADVPASNDDAEYTEVTHRKPLRQPPPPPAAKKRLSSSTSPAVGAEYNVTSHKMAEKVKNTPPPSPHEYSVLDRPDKPAQPSAQEYEVIDISAARQSTNAPPSETGYSSLDATKIGEGKAEQSDEPKKEEKSEVGPDTRKKRISGVRLSSNSDDSIPSSPREKPPPKPKPALLPKPKSSKIPPPLDSARLRRSASPNFTPSPSPSPSHTTAPPEYEIVGTFGPPTSSNKQKSDNTASIDPEAELYEGVDISKQLLTAQQEETSVGEGRKSSTPPPPLPVRGYSTPPRSRESSLAPMSSDRATTQSPTPPLPLRLYTPSPPPSLRDSTDSSKLTDSSKFTASLEEDNSPQAPLQQDSPLVTQNNTTDTQQAPPTSTCAPATTQKNDSTPSSRRRRPPPPPGYNALPRSSSPPPPACLKQQGDYISKSFTLGRQPPKWTVTAADEEEDEEEETSPQKGKTSSGSPSLRSRFKNLFRGSSIHGSDTSRNSYKKKKKNRNPALAPFPVDTKARSQTLPIGGLDPFGLYSTVDGDSEEEDDDDIKPALAYAIVDAKTVKRRSRDPLARARVNELRKSRSVEHLYDYTDITEKSEKSDSQSKSSAPGTPTRDTPPFLQSGELTSSYCSEGSDRRHKSEERSIEEEEEEDTETSNVEPEKEEPVIEELVIETSSAPKRVLVDVPHEMTESGAMYAVINKPAVEQKDDTTPASVVQSSKEPQQQSPVLKRAPAPKAPPRRNQKSMKIIPSPPPQSPPSNPPPVPSSSRPSAPPTGTPPTAPPTGTPPTAPPTGTPPSLKQPPKPTSRSKKAASKYAHLLTSPPPSHPPPLPPGQTPSNNITKNGTIPAPAHNGERQKSPRPHRPGSGKRSKRQTSLDQSNQTRNPPAQNLSLDNDPDGPIYEPIPQGNGPPITSIITKPSTSSSPKLRQLRPKTAPAPPPPNPRRQHSIDNSSAPTTNKGDEISPQRLQNSQQSGRLRGELHSLSSSETTTGPPQFLFSVGQQGTFITVGDQPPSTVISPSISTSTVSSVMEHNDEDSDSTDWDGSSQEDDEEEGEETNEKPVRPPKPKYYYIAQEMLTTERTFVKGLSLLHKDFRQHMLSANRAHEKTVVSEDVLQQILSNIESLFTLNTELLQELETRMMKWDSDPRIGDIFVSRAPFLRLYLQYISNFENAMKTLEDQQKRSSLFSQVLREFEAEPKCAHLPVAGYLLETVQRIPRYKLLLTDYLKHLPEDSQDKESSEKALEIISSVATHVNETMRQMANFKKVVEVSKKLIGDVGDSLVTPHRRLLREGELTKSSRKEKQTRTFFLFTDLLVYTYAIPPANTTFKVIKRIPLDGMRVELLDDPEMRHGFQIISTCKSFRLDASSFEDRDRWMQAFETAIKDHKQRMFSRAAQNRKSVFIEHSDDDTDDVDSNPLGRLAPAWLPDNTVSMCQLCSIRFTVTRRRHHCRACGMIFCSECSSYLVPLPYKNNKICRVCQTCYGQLATDGEEQLSPDRLRTTPRRGKPFRGSTKKNVSMPSVLTEVKARDQNAQVSGYLMFSKERSRGWKKKWFVLYNMVLYEFKKHEDVCAQKSYPVPGYDLQSAPQDPLIFFLQHRAIGRWFFKADSEDHFQRWMDALDKAVKGENPS